MLRTFAQTAALAFLLGACDRPSSPLPQPSIASASSTAASPPPAPPRPAPLVLIAGGDVELARETGKILVRDPSYDPFRRIRPLLDGADLRFVNLECPLSEQRGETQSSWSSLVFTGPPIAAEALARVGIDVVSTANNHIWDYGPRGMEETLHNLDRVAVAHAGASLLPGDAEKPTLLTVRGLRVAFLAFTAVWNQGPLAASDARLRVASGDAQTMIAAVRAVRATGAADFVVVSYHGGEEYEGVPLARVRDTLRAVIDAGADVVLGHHAHVMQAIETRRGRPIFYGLGNLVMRMNSAQRWTELGYLARVVLDRAEQAPSFAVCPYRIDGREPVPLDDARLVTMHLDRLRTISRPSKISFGPPERGCYPVVTTDPP